MTQSKLVHRSARTAVALATILAVTLLLGVSAASAHYTDVTAKTDCDGLVTYTVTAWPNRSAAARTNPNISVWLSRDGGSFTQLPHETQHRFNASNNYSFTDTIQLTEPFPDNVRVKAVAAANWGDGAEPGGSRTTDLITLDNCPPTTTTTSAATTTTTVPSTTTTGGPTTTTTGGETTTTTEAPATTTAGPVTNTTVGGATTTVAGASVTTASPTTSVAVQGIQQSPTTVGANAAPGGGTSLPITGGSGIGTLIAMGVALLGGGAALLARRRAASDG